MIPVQVRAKTPLTPTLGLSRTIACLLDLCAFGFVEQLLGLIQLEDGLRLRWFEGPLLAYLDHILSGSPKMFWTSAKTMSYNDDDIGMSKRNTSTNLTKMPLPKSAKAARAAVRSNVSTSPATANARASWRLYRRRAAADKLFQYHNGDRN